jgi:hypothetical protein
MPLTITIFAWQEGSERKGSFVEVAKLENEVLALVRSASLEPATFSVRSQPQVGGTTSSQGAVGTSPPCQRSSREPMKGPYLPPYTVQ